MDYEIPSFLEGSKAAESGRTPTVFPTALFNRTTLIKRLSAWEDEARTNRHGFRDFAWLSIYALRQRLG
jgi:hypothetical protein